MSSHACGPLSLLPLSRRSGRVSSPARPGWRCLELNDRPDDSVLDGAHELVVHSPDTLSLDVLAAARALRAVVPPRHCRLPNPITAELDRREIATVWQQPPAVSAVGPRPAAGLRPAVGLRPAAGSRPAWTGGCGMSRRGNAS